MKPASLPVSLPKMLPASTVDIPEVPAVPPASAPEPVEPLLTISLDTQLPGSLTAGPWPQAPPRVAAAARRRGEFIALYASFATLQALDVHSTRLAVASGHQEVNPLLASASQSSAGLIAIKAASTVGIIYATEKLRKRNRAAAIALMVGLNTATAVVVAKNYRVSK